MVVEVEVVVGVFVHLGIRWVLPGWLRPAVRLLRFLILIEFQFLINDFLLVATLL